MGIVYEALHVRLAQPVALKMLLPDLLDREDVVARFEREGRAAVRLRSPHVARVFDVDVLPNGTPYMVLELLEGRDLAAELTLRGPLPLNEAIDYILQACDAMAEAHQQGTVHRDLKPSNLFLTRQGTRGFVKVLDFGVSKITETVTPSVTSTRSALGTALYMSPEQVRSAKNVDARTDVWSLGVVLYELLTARSPFLGDSATAVAAAIVVDVPQPLGASRDDLPAELEQVVMKALEKDRENRYPDAAAFARALLPFYRANAPVLVAIDGQHRAPNEATHAAARPSRGSPHTPTTMPSREGDAHPHIGGRARIESEGPQPVRFIDGGNRFVEAPIPSVAPSALSSSPSFPWDTAHAARRAARRRMYRGIALGVCGAGLLGLSGFFLPRVVGGILAQGPRPGGPASMGSAAVLVGVLATRPEVDAGALDSAVASPETLPPAVVPAAAPESIGPDAVGARQPTPVPVQAPKVSRSLAAAHAIKTTPATRPPPPAIPATALPTIPAPEPQPAREPPRPPKKRSTVDLPDDPG